MKLYFTKYKKKSLWTHDLLTRKWMWNEHYLVFVSLLFRMCALFGTKITMNFFRHVALYTVPPDIVPLTGLTKKISKLLPSMRCVIWKKIHWNPHIYTILITVLVGKLKRLAGRDVEKRYKKKLQIFGFLLFRLVSCLIFSRRILEATKWIFRAAEFQTRHLFNYLHSLTCLQAVMEGKQLSTIRLQEK